MKILIAEDEPVARSILHNALSREGYEVVVKTDGQAAWTYFQANPVRVVVSDWMMPGLDGLQFCREVRRLARADYAYFILLTSGEDSRENRHAAIDAGVDDFLTKPLDADQLWMRLRVAERILKYATQVRELEAFLPICSYCKKIRDDQNYWRQIEAYINERTGTDFSHSVCPDCYQSVVRPQLDAIRGSHGSS